MHKNKDVNLPKDRSLKLNMFLENEGVYVRNCISVRAF